MGIFEILIGILGLLVTCMGFLVGIIGYFLNDLHTRFNASESQRKDDREDVLIAKTKVEVMEGQVIRSMEEVQKSIEYLRGRVDEIADRKQS